MNTDKTSGTPKLNLASSTPSPSLNQSVLLSVSGLMQLPPEADTLTLSSSSEEDEPEGAFLCSSSVLSHLRFLQSPSPRGPLH